MRTLWRRFTIRLTGKADVGGVRKEFDPDMKKQITVGEKKYDLVSVRTDENNESAL